jgi:hypothetical protein
MGHSYIRLLRNFAPPIFFRIFGLISALFAQDGTDCTNRFAVHQSTFSIKLHSTGNNLTVLLLTRGFTELVHF